MRNYTLNIRLAAVLVAPLLLACGSDNTGGGTTYAAVPICTGVNQVLSTDTTGQLVCVDLPAGSAGLPECKPLTEALTADGTTFSCTNLNAVDDATKTLLETLTGIEKKIEDYGTQLNTLGAGPGAQAYYRGLTPAATATTGRITSGNLVGIPAATAKCVAEFGAGAHMCTVYEIYYSASLEKGLVKDTKVTPGGWVYQQSWRSASANPTEMDAGLADNCAGYTYDATAANWNGARFEWDTNSASVFTPRIFANTMCNTSLPIACCK